jgi:hypothetical protein
MLPSPAKQGFLHVAITYYDPKFVAEREASKNTVLGKSLAVAANAAAAPIMKVIEPHKKELSALVKVIAQVLWYTYKYSSTVYTFLTGGANSAVATEITMMACGLILAFFGGTFMTVIAAVEAFRMVAWHRTKICMQVPPSSSSLLLLSHPLLPTLSSYLFVHLTPRLAFPTQMLARDINSVAQQSTIDDTIDSDGTGIADVETMNPEQLMMHKFDLCLVACDPLVISEAMGGIQRGLLASLACLRIKFARDITIGSAVSVSLTHHPPLTHHFLPLHHYLFFSTTISLSTTISFSATTSLSATISFSAYFPLCTGRAHDSSSRPLHDRAIHQTICRCQV